MKVYFGSSTSKIDKYYPLYKLICDKISNLGHQLTRDWLDEAKKNLDNDLKINYEEMYHEIIASILVADVCIVEGTVKGLSTGHVMTIALNKGKPLLFLHQDLGNDKFPFIINGAEAHLITEKVYKDQKEIPKIVKDFLDSQKKGKRVRFNLVLAQQENNYLEWATFVHKKTKTDIIRGLIKDKINTDMKYHKDLK